MRKNSKLSKQIGKKVQRQRKLIGLTQEQLAEKVDVSRAYIGYIEQARNAPSLELLQKIARVLRVDIKELF